MFSFLDVLDRAHNGPVIKPQDWDLKVIPTKTREKVKEYGLMGTYTPENLVTSDNGLIDNFWRAGFDLAADIGMLCLTTERVMRFTEEELKEALRNAPHEAWHGSVLMQHRTPEDRRPLTTWLGPFGCVVDEDLIIPVIQSVASYRSVDCIMPACLATIHGRPLKTRTPYETLGGKLEAVLNKEAVRRANRPDMPIEGPGTSPSEYGHLGGFGVPGGLDPKLDINVILATSELKTGYQQLHKVAHSLNMGCKNDSGHWSMIGGYSGTIEAATVSAIASYILQYPVHQATQIHAGILDSRYFGNTGREAIWANCVSFQAQSRNSHGINIGTINPVAGPCTNMILQEAAAIAITAAASGCAVIKGVRTIQMPNHATGLESGFTGEVAKASCGMKRTDANEIVKTFIPKYEGNLKSPPKGKPFQDCYDVKKIQPTSEWIAIYDDVRKNLMDLGVPLE